MIRPDPDAAEPLVQFTVARLRGEECFFKSKGEYNVECGGGFWISDEGSLICENHMAWIYETEKMSDAAKIRWRIVAVPHAHA